MIDSWFTIEKIDDSTFAISEYGHWENVHSYLAVGSEYAALIDTGLGIKSLREITNQLTSLPIKVITSHVHWDHIGSHALFDEIYVHKADANWLKNGIPLPIEQIRKDVIREITIPLPNGFNISEYTPYQGTPTGELNDNDTINLGNRDLRVIHTPGHSPGHICIFEEERGYLFSGDLLYQGQLYAFYPTTDPIQFSDSINKIHDIKSIVKIFPGHHRLPLDRNFLELVHLAFLELKERDLLWRGSGIHEFKGFSIRF